MVAQAVPSWQFELMRRFPRIGLITPVEALCEGTVFTATSRNLSIGGILLVTEHDVPRGAKVHLHFKLPGGIALVAAARVIHCRPGIRAGLEFTDMGSAMRDALSRSIRVEPATARRSIRIPERLFVHLQWDENGTLAEHAAQTVLLSLHGCLLLSESAPALHAETYLSWCEGNVSTPARVVSRQQDCDGLFKVALEFVDDRNFWGIDFDSEGKKGHPLY